ncbi:MAG: sulfatase [bacterium]|nr:sulfatase [bacterium]
MSGYLVLAILALTLGCASPDERTASAWSRRDLWSLRATIERLPEGLEWRAEEAAVMVPHRATTEPWPASVKAPLPGYVRALQTPLGARLGWTVALGEAPYFSFIPLRTGDGQGCRYRYRVGVEPAEGRLIELVSHSVETEARPAPAPVAVDLGPYAGAEVRLLIQTDPASTGCKAQPGAGLWGSPALYDRRPAPPVAGSSERPNVLLISFDALRADMLGAYGRRPSVTPTIDELAAESDVWEWAFSCFNGTNPSFASVMTGLYGKNHGVYELTTPLPDSPPTLAEILTAAGYRSAAILSAHHMRHENSGLGRGFAQFTAAPRRWSAELAADMAMAWIAEQDRPFFLWLHFFDPHSPHTPPQPYALGFRPAVAAGLSPVDSWSAFRSPGALDYRHPRLGAHELLYLGEVAYLDRQVDRLLDFLRSRGLLHTSVLALVSDHGENLTEHGVRFRHSGLWDTTTRIPLLIRWPGPRRPGRTFPGLAQTIDLFPTLLKALGLEVPVQDGRDLRQWTESPSSGRRLVFAEHMERRGAMVRSTEHLYMTIRDHRSLAAGAYLYDLEGDPQQRINLAGSRPEIERELGAILARWQAERRDMAPAPSGPLTEEEQEELRALGYLDR